MSLVIRVGSDDIGLSIFRTGAGVRAQGAGKGVVPGRFCLATVLTAA